MSIQFDIAKQIIAETCPNRKLKLENIRLFADIIQPKKYQKGDIILNEGDLLCFHPFLNNTALLTEKLQLAESDSRFFAPLP
ncbi:hypothetical protein [Mediterranea massiliensis]|uniref:hypothetical protein n=1 Tax=Mediterranea massiliensis TaxID=1841865 RepID=UPI001EF53000|nr:hypothetical protein [Mediterranea massiliensis]